MLRHQFPTILVLLATVGLTVYLYLAPSNLFPQQDTGRFTGTITADQDTSAQAMRKLMQKYAAVTAADPAVVDVVAFTGGSAPPTPAACSSRSSRWTSGSSVSTRSTPASGAKMRPSPGATLILAAGAGPPRRRPRVQPPQYQYTLQGDDVKELNAWAPKVEEKMRQITGLVDVSSDQQNRGLQADLTYDRATVARLGLSTQLVDDTLYDAFGQRQVSTMYTPLNQYHVVMEADPALRRTPTASATSIVRASPTARRCR